MGKRSAAAVARRRAAARARKYVARYGITLEEKQARIKRQGDVCGLCREPFKSAKDTHVDHCHTTWVVRGILCFNCNHGLGAFRDREDLLKDAVHYLRGELL